MERRLTTIQAITNFIFIEDKLIKADLIIIPGTSHFQLPTKAAQLFSSGYSKKLIFTGGFNKKIKIAESDFGKNIAHKLGVPNIAIFRESCSSNTKENALEAKKIIAENRLPHRIIILVSKPYHARRLKMTFSVIFPKSKIKIVSVQDATNITKNNWWKNKEGIKKVMEEIKKIGDYFLKGNLSLTDSA